MSALDRSSREWLTIGEASDLVGVSVATLRRWSNAGEVSAHTTPGGHRRFDRSAVLGLLPASRVSRVGGRTADPLPDQDMVARIVRAYRRANRGVALAPLDRIPAVNAPPYRDAGRQMIASLVVALARPGDGADQLSQARAGAGACGRLAFGDGLSLQEALALFVRFRVPFLHELGASARRRGLDAAATTAMLERASAAIDGLLPAVIAGYQSAG